MTSALRWISGITATLALAACSASDADPISQADQAIKAMEEADAALVQACVAKAQGCEEKHGENAVATCDGIETSCEQLDAELAQIRDRAVTCWESSRECQGEECSQAKAQCQILSDTVGEARSKVGECGQHVQACMLQAAGAPDTAMLGVCAELQAACSAGVTEAAVTQVQEMAQTQTQDGEGDAVQTQAEDAVQTQAQDATEQQEQIADGEATQTQDQSGEAAQARQQLCLEKVAACGAAAGGNGADLAQLHQSGEACDLSDCGA